MRVVTCLIVLTSLLMTSCGVFEEWTSPELYTLDKNYTNSISGVILSELPTVVQTYDNEIMLQPGALTSLRVPELTQYNAQFNAKLMEGNGVRFAMRSTPKTYATNPGLTLDYTTSGCVLSENNRILTTVDSIKAGQGSSIIHFMNNGKMFIITVGCDTVYNGATYLPATEYIIVSTLKDTKALLSGIQFDNVIPREELTQIHQGK
jgi:hypothetical protein